MLDLSRRMMEKMTVPERGDLAEIRQAFECLDDDLSKEWSCRGYADVVVQILRWEKRHGKMLDLELALA